MFENPKIFILFSALPVIVFFMVLDILILKKRVNKIAGKNTEIVIPYHSEGQKWLKIIFYTLAIILSIIGLARPKWGVESIDSKIKGKDVYILLDVSNSMAVKDVIPSRLELAKLNIQTLFELETGDRYGLIIFSDEPTIMSPLTHDYAAISFFLESLTPGMIGKGGTNIPNAIYQTANLLENEITAERIILMLTDGENIQGDIKNIIKKVKDEDIKIFTAGVGTEEGKLIPIKNANDEIIDYIKDDAGKPVRSRLDENQLKYIANETGAVYFGSVNRKTFIKDAFNNLKNLKTIDHGKISYKQKTDRYDLFILPALILFCLGFILDQGKIIKFHEKSLSWMFDKKNLVLLITFLLLIFNNSMIFSISDNTSDIMENNNIFKDPNGGFWGNLSFKKGNFKKALQQYKSAVSTLNDELLTKLYYNIGNTYMFLNDNKNAMDSYENAAALGKKDRLLAKIFYNQGLCAFKEHNYEAAAELFKKSLNYNDQDDDTRYNYVISNLLKDESQKNQNEQKTEENNEEKNNDKKQNDNNQSSYDEKNLNKKDIENILKALEEKEKRDNKRNNNYNSRNQSW
ncbi:MAG: VWA domain-containing protein [Spirochaetes bacterium]|nr:VWA domain-containing protein [Spirochaetota bacterium]